MRSIKLLGLAVLGVLAVLAFTGVGSAGATVLCEEGGIGTERECPANKIVPKGTILKGQGTATFGSFGVEELPVTCNSNLEYEVGENHGASKPLDIAGIMMSSFSGCKWEGITTCHSPGPPFREPFSGEVTTENGGTLKATKDQNGSSLTFELEFEACHRGANEGHCLYKAAAQPLNFSVESTKAGRVVTLNNVEMTEQYKVFPVCSKKITMSGSYALGKVSVEGEAEKATLSNLSHSAIITCASKMSGGVGALSSLTFSGCDKQCKSAKALNLPYSTSYNSGAGTLTVSSGGSGSPTIEFYECSIFNLHCAYSASSLVLDLKGSTEFIASDEHLKRGSCNFETAFPEETLWSATFSGSMGGDILAVTAKP